MKSWRRRTALLRSAKYVHVYLGLASLRPRLMLFRCSAADIKPYALALFHYHAQLRNNFLPLMKKLRQSVALLAGSIFRRLAT